MLVLVVAAGCATQPPAPASRPAGPEDDRCSERLQDLAGQLLMFYMQHRQLPQDLSQLGPDAPKPVCPVCGKPYLYNPQGLAVPTLSARAIVWDELPCHSGIRWGIVMEPPKPGQSLRLQVIRLPAEPVPQSP
jgi:hypothetical protein